jgi:hypothetical protein
MDVVREHGKRVDSHAVLALSAADDPDGEVVEAWGGTEQEAALNGAERDFDYGSPRQET